MKCYYNAVDETRFYNPHNNYLLDETNTSTEESQDWKYWLAQGLGFVGVAANEYLQYQQDKDEYNGNESDNNNNLPKDNNIMGLSKPIFYMLVIILLIVAFLAIKKFSK